MTYQAINELCCETIFTGKKGALIEPTSNINTPQMQNFSVQYLLFCHHLLHRILLILNPNFYAVSLPCLFSFILSSPVFVLTHVFLGAIFPFSSSLLLPRFFRAVVFLTDEPRNSGATPRRIAAGSVYMQLYPEPNPQESGRGHQRSAVDLDYRSSNALLADGLPSKHSVTRCRIPIRLLFESAATC